MPYQKLKNENYQNLGGINQKASPFMTGANEALALLNWDFSRPGAYTQRPGTTQYIGGGGSACLSFYEFSRLSGASYKLFNFGGTFVAYNGATRAGLFGVSVPTQFDIAAFVDRAFCANGDQFFKTDGITANLFSLPPVSPNTIVSASVSATSTSGWTGTYVYQWAYLNNRGYLGPVQQMPAGGFGTYPGYVLGASNTWSVSVGLSTALDPAFATISPDQYGISAIVMFRSKALDSPTRITYLPSVYDVQSGVQIQPFSSTSVVTFTDAGMTYGPKYTTGSTLGSNYLWFTLAPRHLNIYNNAGFYFGFSSLLSTVYFSNLGEPEGVGATASFEVRSNDGDRLTGAINYRQAQIFSKLRSMHYLTGFSSDDYSLNELTDQYGCISNRAMCVWQDKLWFLDSNGIAEYNGGRVAKVSNRVEQTFRRMNVQAAIDQAVMLHVKERNEIWCAFPIDGATRNNYLVVYDYVADAWTEWQGPQCASLALATGPSLLLQPFYGDYSGAIHYFDPIFYSDSGRAFTCSITSRYFGDLGYSVTKQFRRLYFDMVMQQSAGVTHLMTVNLFSDMNSNASAFSTTFAISSSLPQQNRIDFGVPGKTLSFQLTHIAQDSALQFSGFTVEYRFQRAV